MEETALIEFSVVANKACAKMLINKIKKTMRKDDHSPIPSPIPCFTDPLQAIDVKFESGEKIHMKCGFVSMCIENKNRRDTDWVNWYGMSETDG